MVQSRQHQTVSTAINRSTQDSGPRGSGPPNEFTELIESAYSEDEVASLDFDNASQSRTLQETEPGSDFDTIDDHYTPYLDVADATDAIDDVDVLSDLDLSVDDLL